MNNAEREKMQIAKAGMMIGAQSPKRAVAINNGRQYTNIEKIIKECNDPKILLIVSGRGSGKSWSAADFLEKDFDENGHKFILLSRDIIKTRAKSLWFHQPYIRLEGSSFYKIKGKEKVHIGYNWNLHQFADYKSANAHADVYNILFEEFIELEHSDYWDNEYSMFLSILNTILARASDRIDWGRVIMLGNNELGWQSNPYLQEFNPNMPYQGIKVEEPTLLCENDIFNVVFYRAPMGYIDKSQIHWSGYMPGNDLLLTGDTKKVDDMLEVFIKKTAATFKSTGRRFCAKSSFCNLTFEICELQNRRNAPQFLLVYNGLVKDEPTYEIITEKHSKKLLSAIVNIGLRVIFKDDLSYGNYGRLFTDFSFANYYLTNTDDLPEDLPNNIDYAHLSDLDKEKIVFDYVLKGTKDIRLITSVYNIPEKVYKRYGL